MKILNENNKIIDLDVERQKIHYSVLSFKNFKEPDFFFIELTGLELIECASASLTIGDFSVVVPFPWCILSTNTEDATVDCLPIVDLLGKNIPAFCINPIDGYRVEFPSIKLTMIYPNGSFLIPPLGNKDMLVVPLGYTGRKRLDENKNPVDVGPICAIFSPTKMEVNRSIIDIW
jgi:hypothetical protein